MGGGVTVQTLLEMWVCERKVEMVIQCVVLIYLALLSVIDFRRKALPVWLLCVGMVTAVSVSCFGLWLGKEAFPELLFGCVPGILLLCLSGLQKGIGTGDGVVLLQINLFWSLEKTVLAFCISMLGIGLFSVALLLLRMAKKETRLPYMPFLWLGCVGAVFL